MIPREISNNPMSMIRFAKKNELESEKFWQDVINMAGKEDAELAERIKKIKKRFTRNSYPIPRNHCA